MIKIFLILLSALILSQVSEAATLIQNQTFLLAPTDYLLNDSCGSDINQFPIACAANTSSASLCEVSRTLGKGETYALQNSQCNLRFECPESTCTEIKNVTEYTRFRFEQINGTILVTYLNTNETRLFDPAQTNLVEQQFAFVCPAINSRPEVREFTPLNITDDNFFGYCIEPFVRSGERLVDASVEFSNLTVKLVSELAVCQESNKALSGENGKNNERIANMEASIKECTTWHAERDRFEREKNDLTVELQNLKSQRMILGIIAFIMGTILGMLFFFKEGSKFFWGGMSK